MATHTRRWRSVASDPGAVAELARALRIPPAVAAVLAARGYAERESTGRFLNPRLADITDPFCLPGMAEAVERIWKAVDAGERMVVFGDYDADGVTSSALLVDVLRHLGAPRVDAFVPCRFADGYGLTMSALARCLDSKRPDLLITVDCGTMSVEAVATAQARGTDVVVTDHHAVSGAAAAAVALVNPKLGASQDSTTSLAGVGVAFKLCHALVKEGLRRGRDAARRIDLRDWLDLVATGTVADVVPLTGENRILVRHGLDRINRSPSVGLQALIREAGVDTDLDCYHLGFLIGPRLNAAGRLGSAERAVRLLLTRDADEARGLARELSDENARRRRIEDGIREQAEACIGEICDPRSAFGLVAAGRDWHSGTVGIVAARLCSMYYRPTVVVSIDEDGLGHGSGRSIEEIDLVDVLSESAELLERYGGHRMAAGLTVRADRLESFRKRFEASCRERLAGTDLRPSIEVDGWLRMPDADDGLLQAIRMLKPMGMGNPEPVWGVRGVRLAGPPRVVGRNHLKLLLAAGGTQMDAIGFGLGEQPVPDGELDVLFTLRENVYRGRRSLQLQVKDFRPSGMAD